MLDRKRAFFGACAVMCRLVESLRRGGVVSWTRDFLREYRAEREADEQAKQEEDEQKEGANDETE